MQNSFLISIVIPVYNVEKYLQECISSIKNCDKDKIEIIFVDDGSTDQSGIICKNYSEKNYNVKYVRQENKGLSEARNTGIRKATGEYILFLDSDDYLYPNALEQIQNDITMNNECDFYIGRAYEFLDGDKKYDLCQMDYDLIKEKTPIEIFQRLDKNPEFWFAAWLIIIRRQFLLENTLFFKSGIYHEDELWVPTVFVKASSIGMLNYGFYCYRKNREGSIVSAPKIKREFDKLIIVEEFDKIDLLENKKIYIIRKRQAALIWGIILHINFFYDDMDIKKLEKELEKKLCKLKCGKYYIVYLGIKIFGVRRISSAFSKNKTI